MDFIAIIAGISAGAVLGGITYPLLWSFLKSRQERRFLDKNLEIGIGPVEKVGELELTANASSRLRETIRLMVELGNERDAAAADAHRSRLARLALSIAETGDPKELEAANRLMEAVLRLNDAGVRIHIAPADQDPQRDGAPLAAAKA